MLPLHNNLAVIGRIFYAAAIAGIGFQLCYHQSFHPVIVPAWPAIEGKSYLAWIAGVLLIAAGITIAFSKQTRNLSLILGGLLLILFFCQIPFEIIHDPYVKHLGSWTNALKELALSGGAFVAAGLTQSRKPAKPNFKLLEKCIPAGPSFFAVTMLCFGIAHFLYTDFVLVLIPSWIPNAKFWTYFGGVALAGAAAAIILGVKVKLVSFLLGLMIFIWLIILHIPRAIAEPMVQNGNEVTSAFTALAFSGIAFMISARSKITVS
ncbi:MAG: hypothetical protein H7Y27_13480 [Gemmatimonadaceae bacterium]|nr:hypothetical protein [Chitinophagaceae bacterium]